MKYKDRIDLLIKEENKRQENTITLIASENYAPKDVLKAQGSILTNKYIEGYPNKRYYGGCSFIDEIEKLGIQLAKKIFKAEHVNLQPHSGSQANAAVYLALLKPNDKVLAMALESGGHLTHGHTKSFSGKLYHFEHYYVNKKTERLDYDEIEKQAQKLKPKLIIAGASSYSRIIDFKKFSNIAKKVRAYLLVDMAHIAGLVAANCHPSPIPYADVVTTTTHKTLRGARGGIIFCKKELKNKIDNAVFPGTQGGLLFNAVAGKVYMLAEALTSEYKEYQKKVKEFSNYFSKAFKRGRIVSGGTDNHQFTIDVMTSYGISGKEAETLLEQSNIIVNKNLIPFDPLTPRVTSGIRIGTPAITTRGFGKTEISLLAKAMEELLVKKDKKTITKTKNLVSDLCKRHKVYT